MSRPAERNKKYTYGDYLSWPEDERWELIEGIPYNMTPAPSVQPIKEFQENFLGRSVIFLSIKSARSLPRPSMCVCSKVRKPMTRS